MQLNGKQLFRQEALDRLTSPEDLDQLMQGVKPRSWLALLAMSAIATAAATWSVFGRIPLTVTGQGILIQPRQVVQIQAASAGRLLSLTVQPGDTVKPGQVIGVIDQSALQQQLQQAQAKLAELQQQQQTKDQLQQQWLGQELETLQQQQQDLQDRLQREQAALNLWQQTQSAIAAKRSSLNQRQQQIQTLLRSLQERVDSRQQLLEQQVISRDMLLQAEQDYFNMQAQMTDVDVQLRELDIQQATAQQDYGQRLNAMGETETKLQQLTAQMTQVQRQSLQESGDRTNQIQDLQRQIAQLQLQLSRDANIVSQSEGKILELSIVPGQMIQPGDRLGSLDTNQDGSELTSFVYFRNQDGKQVQPGMTVQVTPSVVQRDRYGGILGQVTAVSPFPVTPQDIATTVGNAEVAKSLTSQGEALIQVVAQLETDPTTESGYRWSASVGPSMALSSGTTASVRVKVGEQAPIAYLLPLLRTWTGWEA